MGENVKDPPPYIIPVGGSDVKVYHTHTPFNHPDSQLNIASATPVYSSEAGTGLNTGLDTGEGKSRFVSYDGTLGRNPGQTTCTSCQQQVTTTVTYKAGTYAWLMCLLFICCGLILCCCLIPFFMNNFKDAYHTCPRCNRVLHVDKKQCCK
ncbi:lITAF domain-containing protein [Sebastes fasciatus]|uniref:lITAF domain-containing protein n=1 Tax=Sebastes fasciatus TaxID=394691 RepID=UPI003D9E69AB